MFVMALRVPSQHQSGWRLLLAQCCQAAPVLLHCPVSPLPSFADINSCCCCYTAAAALAGTTSARTPSSLGPPLARQKEPTGAPSSSSWHLGQVRWLRVEGLRPSQNSVLATGTHCWLQACLKQGLRVLQVPHAVCITGWARISSRIGTALQTEALPYTSAWQQDAVRARP